MKPEWLHSIEETVGNNNDATVVGVAICLIDPNVPVIHAGVIYRDPGEVPRLLHLAFHAIVRHDTLPDVEHRYYWVPLRVDVDRAISIAGFCRRVAKRGPRIPYGIVYDGGRLRDDGMVELANGAIGLTCATFALALFKWAGCEMLDLKTWCQRKEDEMWHAHIVSLLHIFHRRHPELLQFNHIAAVEQEKGCARFRPEEVAAACALPWPVTLIQAEPVGAEARMFILDEQRHMEGGIAAAIDASGEG